MKLSQTCIDRPVLSIVISLVIIVAGILSYHFLDLRYYPKTFKPKLYVMTFLSGASPQVMEDSITQKLESALTQVPHLEDIESETKQGRSQIELHFKSISKQDFITAQSQALSLIARVRLPEGATTPMVTTSRDGSQIMMLTFTDPHKSAQELADYISDFVIKPLRRIPGTANVELNGLVDSALRVDIKPEKLAAFGLTVSDVIQTIEKSNTTVSLGQVSNELVAMPVNVTSRLESIDEIKNLVLKQEKGQFVYLHQVASVKMGAKGVLEGFNDVNGQPGALINVGATDDANPMEVGREVRQAIEQMKTTMPQGMTVSVMFDISSNIHHSVQEVYHTIIEAVFLVALITILFLGKARAALIPIVTVPVCLIGVFTVVAILGFSINIMTLLALVLAVGLVVDDAIVVQENTTRHIEHGMAPIAAAKKSINEISFAVIGMTVTLLVVYLPTGFITGSSGVYFREFAFTLAACVLISGFVALTLSPMMCAKLLKKQSDSKFEKIVGIVLNKLSHVYFKTLQWSLNHKAYLMSALIVLILIGMMIFKTLPSALTPKNNIGVIGFGAASPETASLIYAKRNNDKLLAVVKQSEPDIVNLVTFGGWSNNQVFNFISLKPEESRSKSIDDIVEGINKAYAQLPDVKGGAFVPSLSPGSGGHRGKGSLGILVLGTSSYDQLNKDVITLVDELKAYPGVNNVSTDLKFDNEEFEIKINRVLAAKLGVSQAELIQSLSTLLGGYSLKSGFQIGAKDYPIIIQLSRKNLEDFSALDHAYVKTSDGKQVQLSRLLTIHVKKSLKIRNSFNQMRAAGVNMEVAPGYTTGQVVNKINTIVKNNLSQGTQIAYSGSAKKMQQSNQNLAMMFGLSLIFIYLVLAALFESFIDPFIILFTVPVSIVGALLALKIIGGSINLYTGIGLVTLVGLITKHGVLITQFANDRIQQGKSVIEAASDAAKTRFRPILMTTITMVLGALPLALASGPDAQARLQIGWVIVAGLIVGSLFSLYVVPVAYILLSRFKRD